MQHAVADDKQILARTFADEAVHIERNAFGVAVDHGFHLNELRVHVIRARLRHRGQSVRRQPRPRRNTNIDGLICVRPQIFSPRIIDDVNLGRAVEGGNASLAVSAQNDGADVARPHAIALHQFDHGPHDLIAGEGDVNAVNASRVDEALHVLGSTENGGAGGQRVTANAFKHRRAVVHNVRHHVQGSVVPGDEFAVVPDFFRLLNRHADSFGIEIRGSAREFSELSKKFSPSRIKL